MATPVAWRSAFWETVFMSQRGLQITNRVGGTPIAGICTFCGALFRLESNVVDPNSAQSELEQKFAKHKCEGQKGQ
jgi:hypothetical protein